MGILNFVGKNWYITNDEQVVGFMIFHSYVSLPEGTFHWHPEIRCLVSIMAFQFSDVPHVHDTSEESKAKDSLKQP